MSSMMPFRKTYPSLCTVLVELEEMAYQVQLLPFISQVMTRISVSWRNWGIKFTPKMVKDGEFQDTYDRDRRANREKKQDKLDIE